MAFLDDAAPLVRVAAGDDFTSGPTAGYNRVNELSDAVEALRGKLGIGTVAPVNGGVLVGIDETGGTLWRPLGEVDAGSFGSGAAPDTQVLMSDGAGNASWIELPAGTATPLSDAPPQEIITPATSGTAASAARADHRHPATGLATDTAVDDLTATVNGHLSAHPSTGQAAYSTPANEQQQILALGTPTAAFVLELQLPGSDVPAETPPIPLDATSVVVQAALEQVDGVAPGDVSVTGGPLPTNAIVVTFTGTLAARNIATMTVTDNAEEFTVQTVQEGVAPGDHDHGDSTQGGSLSLSTLGALSANYSVAGYDPSIEVQRGGDADFPVDTVNVLDAHYDAGQPVRGLLSAARLVKVDDAITTRPLHEAVVSSIEPLPGPGRGRGTFDPLAPGSLHRVLVRIDDAISPEDPNTYLIQAYRIPFLGGGELALFASPIVISSAAQKVYVEAAAINTDARAFVMRDEYVWDIVNAAGTTPATGGWLKLVFAYFYEGV